MRLQTIVEEMGLREAPPLLPVLSKEGTVQVVRGYAGGLFGAGDGDGNGVEVEVDVRRDLLALGTCTFVYSFLFLSLSLLPIFPFSFSFSFFLASSLPYFLPLSSS